MNETVTDTSLRDRIAGLLNRYPALDPIERDELIAFIKTGPAVDRGMLKGDPVAAAAIRRVEADHPEHFRLGLGRQLFVAAAILLPFLAICWLAWEVGAK
ncbi:hypothetical protein K9B35_09125 [Sphingomonas sp. R647]|uniref:hypothetical protein n=1 Tax=Sphingomonas sp. R647 TaxID=2875233 RepID=UPI001CD1974D|nr:hypothetical protein [Sphingomonas sp. R647]MCA1198129.1 hypothetical protein [Sphingomonas sp. R647]